MIIVLFTLSFLNPVLSFKDRSQKSISAKRLRVAEKKTNNLSNEILDHITMCKHHVEASIKFQDGTSASCALPEFDYVPTWKTDLVLSLEDCVHQSSILISITPDYPDKQIASNLRYSLEPYVNEAKIILNKFVNSPLTSEIGNEVSFNLLSRLARHFNIEDADFVENLVNGAALGIENEIESVPGNLWPSKSYKSKISEPNVPIFAKSLAYSAITNFDKLSEMLHEEIDLGWIKPFRSEDAVARVTLHLLQKVKSDSSIKYRLISDYSRNGVNRLSSLKWSITLVRLLDVKLLITAALKYSKNILFGELDIESAFRLIGVRSPEEKYLYFKASVGDKSVEGTSVRLPFGLRVSPFIFTRFFSVFGRLVKVLLSGSGCCCLIYVDDVLFVSASSEKEALFCFSLIIILALALNIPWSLTKLRKPGRGANFIGFKMSSATDCVNVDADPKKLIMIKNFFDDSLKSGKVDTSNLHSVVGKLVFVTSVNPLLRTFLTPLYGFLIRAQKENLYKPSLGKKETWMAFNTWSKLLDKPENFSLEIRDSTRWLAGSDASTKFVAAWACDPNNPGSFRWSRLSVEALFTHLPFLRGSGRLCGDVAVLELIGVSLATYISPRAVNIYSITDSSSASFAVKSKKSRSDRMSSILHKCQWSLHRIDITHLPGSENWLADKLSRDDSYFVPGFKNINISEFCNYIFTE
jgi:hypothetical protein